MLVKYAVSDFNFLARFSWIAVKQVMKRNKRKKGLTFLKARLAPFHNHKVTQAKKNCETVSGFCVAQRSLQQKNICGAP